MGDCAVRGLRSEMEAEEKGKKFEAIEKITKGILDEAVRRGGSDGIRVMYGVFTEVGLHMGLIFDEMRKEERA